MLSRATLDPFHRNPLGSLPLVLLLGACGASEPDSAGLPVPLRTQPGNGSNVEQDANQAGSAANGSQGSAVHGNDNGGVQGNNAGNHSGHHGSAGSHNHGEGQGQHGHLPCGCPSSPANQGDGSTDRGNPGGSGPDATQGSNPDDGQAVDNGGLIDHCHYNRRMLAVGEEFRAPDGCNACRCAKGGVVKCTEQRCGGEKPETPDDKPPGNPRPCQTSTGVVPPGTSFPSDDGCNLCYCAGDGDIACTQRACTPKDVKGCIYGDAQYRPGQSFFLRDECTVCRCEDNGKVNCSRRPCRTEPKPVEVCQTATGVIAIGQSFRPQGGCTVCTCNANGVLACTQRACPPQRDDNSCSIDGNRVHPGERFLTADGCRRCTCDDRCNVTCSQRACGSQA